MMNASNRGSAAFEPFKQLAQFLEADRFGQVVVEAGFGGVAAVFLFSPTGQRDQRDGCGQALITNPAGEFVAIEVGKPDVEDGSAGCEFREERERRTAVKGHAYLAPDQFEEQLEASGGITIVFHHEDRERSGYVLAFHPGLVFLGLAPPTVRKAGRLAVSIRAVSVALVPQDHGLPFGWLRTGAHLHASYPIEIVSGPPTQSSAHSGSLPGSGLRGCTRIVFSLVHMARPGFAPRGLRTYLRKV